MRLSFIGHGTQAMGCQCSGQLPLGEQIRQVLGGLALAYGEQITGEFIDLDKPDEASNPLATRCLAEKRELPALFLDGELRFEGVIPLTALKSLLDEIGLKPIEYHPET